MLVFIACFVGVLALLVFAELLWRSNLLTGEYQRKFVHIIAGSFFASWPWLLSWRQIQLMGLLMLVVVLANRFDQILHFSADLRDTSLGGLCLALAVTVCALITKNNIFFAVAMLNTSVADGMAALAGTRFGKHFRYHVFGQLKTAIGTMAFWTASLVIIGAGLIFAHSYFSFSSYIILLAFLPPALALIENITPFGLDNITVSVTALLALKLAVI